MFFTRKWSEIYKLNLKVLLIKNKWPFKHVPNKCSVRNNTIDIFCRFWPAICILLFLTRLGQPMCFYHNRTCVIIKILLNVKCALVIINVAIEIFFYFFPPDLEQFYSRIFVHNLWRKPKKKTRCVPKKQIEPNLVLLKPLETYI